MWRPGIYERSSMESKARLSWVCNRTFSSQSIFLGMRAEHGMLGGWFSKCLYAPLPAFQWSRLAWGTGMSLELRGPSLTMRGCWDVGMSGCREDLKRFTGQVSRGSADGGPPTRQDGLLCRPLRCTFGTNGWGCKFSNPRLFLTQVLKPSSESGCRGTLDGVSDLKNGSE